MLTMIINKEMWFQLDKSMIHNLKLNSKTILCNQEMVNIPLCSINKRARARMIKKTKKTKKIPVMNKIFQDQKKNKNKMSLNHLHNNKNKMKN